MKHAYSTVRLQRLPVSFLVQKRAVLVTTLLVVLLLTLSLVSLSTGSNPIRIERVIRTLLGQGTRIEQFTILTLRLPRIWMGILVGVGLSLSGAILQGLTKNPLA